MGLCKTFIISIFIFLNCVSCAEVDSIDSIDLISNVDLFDIGLAKINNDQYYDIYTINHVFAESILIADKNKFKEQGLSLGLSQTNGMPDYESTGRSPIIKNGLNIYSAQRKQLILYCHQCDGVVKGKIKIPTPQNDKTSLTLVKKEKAKFSIKSSIEEENKHFQTIVFSIESSGLIVLDVTFMDLLIDFEIDFPAKSIYLGEFSNSPQSNKFTMSSRDNHSFAWAKVNNDTSTDVYMATGGLRALIKQFHPQQTIKELFYIKDPKTQKYIDMYDQAGMTINTCRTYRSEWVDFDKDGDLDLYLGCKNGPNLMQQQLGVGSGMFLEVGAKYKLDFNHGDEFKWIDLNNDGTVDLVTIQKNRLMIYQNNINRNNEPNFRKIKTSGVLGKKLDSVSASIKTIDINNNGIPEIFVSTKSKVYYFEYDKRRGYVKKNISRLNLPKDLSGNLNFVDVNLDGYLDICVFNTGIFLQNKDNKFNKSNLFPELFIDRKYHFKNILWFDSDMNGEWDVLNAESFNEPNRKKIKLLSYKYKDIKVWDKLKLHKNMLQKTNNWLQIDLIGSDFNQDAIGAKVQVKNSNGLNQTRFNHGTSDSYHSQGHYRQYFGLGKDTNVDIIITWPDGKITNFKSIEANQLLVVKYNS